MADLDLLSKDKLDLVWILLFDQWNCLVKCVELLLGELHFGQSKIL